MHTGRQHLRLFFCVHFAKIPTALESVCLCGSRFCGTPIPSVQKGAASKTLLSDYPRIIEKGRIFSVPFSFCRQCKKRFSACLFRERD